MAKKNATHWDIFKDCGIGVEGACFNTLLCPMFTIGRHGIALLATSQVEVL